MLSEMTLRGEKSLLSLMLLLAAVLVASNNWLSSVDGLVYDFGRRWISSVDTRGIVLVNIDKTSLDKIGRWPWPKRIQSELLEKICADHPRAIALNALYSDFEEDAKGNEALAEQIDHCGNVVLPMVIKDILMNGSPVEILPNKNLAQVAKGIGRISMRAGVNGVGLGVDLLEGIGSPAWPLMGAVVLKVAGYKNNNAKLNNDNYPITHNPYVIFRKDFRLLNFVRYDESFSSVSASNLLAAPVPPHFFKDKIVVVGTTSGFVDEQGTPMSFRDGQNGIEDIANVIVNLRDSRLVVPTNFGLTILITAIFATIPMIWITRMTPLDGLLASLCWASLIFIGAAAMPQYLHIWFPPSGVLFAAILVYPLWSWRRLEASQRHMDWQLQQLVAQKLESPMSAMSYEQRIEHLRIVQSRYKELQAQRDEMLAFFSHDIRAPIAIVASQIAGSDLADSVKQRLILQLNRAHDLAQGFLSIIRAQSIEKNSFEDIDLPMVLHQSIDNFYEKSLQLKVNLIRQLPSEPVWIKGDFGLLQRAFENLLQNALKYAPAYSEIVIKLEVNATKKVSILDAGPGVSPERVPHLFKKFSAEGAAKGGVTSNGLGLYFVQTVASRHNGFCGYLPRTPHGSCFWFEI